MVQSLLFVHISKFETIPQCWSRWWWFVRRGVFEALGVAQPVFRPHMAPDMAALPPCVFSSPPVTFFISSLPSSTLASSSPTTLSSAATPPKSMLDTSFRKLLIEEHQQLFEEFFVREPSTKELELKKTAPGENVGETEAHHYRTPVQYCSSKERRGWIACVVPWWPWGRWSIKPPSKKSHRKLQSVMRVVPVPILPKPQQHSSHRSPLVLVVSRPILPEPQQRRHWMTCTSRTIPITENLAKVFRKVLKINYVWIDI